ncbi:glycosyltransferase family 4 protein [Botrimarina sp.]|uniref:glycosyltransferase family 4 protein n=1 Tax=Botrimarina sp. TaxID=2795802 RepID=UPI0032EEEDB7
MTDPATRSLLINALSVGTGGGYTVAREVARHIALARPGWRVTVAAIRDHKLQSEFDAEAWPDNVELLWTPARNADPRVRARYERTELAEGIGEAGYDAVLQLNGMVIPGLSVPTFAHFQDPFPYRPEAWTTFKERVAAWLKRRAHRRALKTAAVCGWTSRYLEQLITARLGVRPKESIVFYNGVPDEWVERASGELPGWSSRPMTMVTVSNVWPYKRQSLVIEALPKLRHTPGLEGLEYHILGAGPDDYLQELRDLATRLGVGDAVHVEGRVSDARVEEALASARVMPLMSLCESFGIPTIEAMAYGTPVVVADCCALPEVCGDGALVTPVDDADALADTLRRVLTDEGLVDQLRSAGAARVARFRWREIGARMADTLDRVIGG